MSRYRTTGQVLTTMIKKLCSLTLLSAVFSLLSLCATAQAPAFCDNDDCLFWAPQPEQIDSAVITYAQNVWSIDEWDNNLGCGFFNQCENLNMLVYYPKLQAGEKRPLVVLIHGGGFITGDYKAFQAAAKSLAGLGYVAVTINYRLCKRNNCLIIANTGCLNLCNGNFGADFNTGAYVATLDATNAIRYLQQHAEQYHIDPENVIVGGHSAGAWTAMNVAFMDQAEANAMGSSWQGSWGSLNPVTGIKGVFCLAGAVVDTNLIDPNERYPVFVLHGTCDPTLCYDNDAIFHCNSSYQKVFGGSLIAERLRHLGHAYYMFSGLGMGHDIGPLQTEWMPELLRFMKSAMLCGQFIQKHSTASLDPGSSECTLLQSDIQGCDLQHNHAQLPPVDLELSPAWNGFPPPCGNGLLSSGEPLGPPWIKAYPTVVQSVFTLETLQGSGDVRVSILNARGQEFRKLTVHDGSFEHVDMHGAAAGIYFLHCRSSTGRAGLLRLIVMNVER